jgi:hypothetical protein
MHGSFAGTVIVPGAGTVIVSAAGTVIVSVSRAGVACARTRCRRPVGLDRPLPAPIIGLHASGRFRVR